MNLKFGEHDQGEITSYSVCDQVQDLRSRVDGQRVEIEAHRAIHVRWGRSVCRRASSTMPVKVAREDLDIALPSLCVVSIIGANRSDKTKIQESGPGGAGRCA